MAAGEFDGIRLEVRADLGDVSAPAIVGLYTVSLIQGGEVVSIGSWSAGSGYVRMLDTGVEALRERLVLKRTESLCRFIHARELTTPTAASWRDPVRAMLDELGLPHVALISDTGAGTALDLPRVAQGPTVRRRLDDVRLALEIAESADVIDVGASVAQGVLRRLEALAVDLRPAMAVIRGVGAGEVQAAAAPPAGIGLVTGDLDAISDVVRDIGSTNFIQTVAAHRGSVNLAADLGTLERLVVASGRRHRRPNGVVAVERTRSIDDRRLDLEIRTPDGSAIDTNEPLPTDVTLTLAVQITKVGYEHSIFDVRPDPVVGSLGPADQLGGWSLEVAIYGHEFTVIGPTVQPLRLRARTRPDASVIVEEITFELLAPADIAERSYRFRVGVYHDSNLAQMLMITSGPLGTRARLEADRVGDLSSTADLGSRVVSLATNADPDGRRHTLLMLTGKLQRCGSRDGLTPPGGV